MSILHALILGIVEGVTEFLPISSTAHLVLSTKILGVAQSDFVKSFEIIIQLGAIAAVLVMYLKILLKNFTVWKKIIAAFFPTAVVGFVLYHFIKKYLIGNVSVVAWGLLVGGIFIICFEYWYKGKNTNNGASTEKISKVENIPYSSAVLIGLAQSIAIIPGVSRSAATIVSGMFLSVSRKTAVEFSFLLALPTIAAAALYDVLKNAGGFSNSNISVLVVGFVASFIAAWFTVKFFIRFVQTNTLSPFGIYRMIVGVLIILFFI